MGPSTPFYTYWLPPSVLDAIRSEYPFRPVKGIPCRGMSPRFEYAYVPPEEWNNVCNRQGGWYRESDKAGLYLVITRRPLEALEAYLETVIEEDDFQPDRLPGEEEIEQMAESPEFLERAPEGWETMSLREKGYWGKLLARIGSSRSPETILRLHSANHANFITGRFAREENGGKAPYSIGGTGEVCSACVELFNLLGKEFPTKYVVPCPGYAEFAGAEPNRYLRVTTPARKDLKTDG